MSIESSTTSLVARTSRRGLLARGGRLLLGLVGASAALEVLGGEAHAAASDEGGIPASPCDCGHGICSSTCTCGANRAFVCYACNDCSHKRCCCTAIAC